jgi:RimJ/RimL family protein N-acetyltransferase
MRYFGSGETKTAQEIELMVYNNAHNNNLLTPKNYAWSIITHDGISDRVYIFYPNDKEKNYEISYCINPNHGGKGYATDAARLVINFVKPPFVATVHPLNIASRKVLKKLGGKTDLSRQDIPKYGSVRDYYLLEPGSN